MVQLSMNFVSRMPGHLPSERISDQSLLNCSPSGGSDV